MNWKNAMQKSFVHDFCMAFRIFIFYGRLLLTVLAYHPKC